MYLTKAAIADHNMLCDRSALGKRVKSFVMNATAELEFAVDIGIKREVVLLRAGGVETFESCEGGPGHAFPEPTVRFHGDKAEGMRALSVALANGLRVFELRRYYTIIDGEPVGPHWEMVFLSTARAGQSLA